MVLCRLDPAEKRVCPCSHESGGSISQTPNVSWVRGPPDLWGRFARGTVASGRDRRCKYQPQPIFSGGVGVRGCLSTTLFLVREARDSAGDGVCSLSCHGEQTTGLRRRPVAPLSSLHVLCCLLLCDSCVHWSTGSTGTATLQLSPPPARNEPPPHCLAPGTRGSKPSGWWPSAGQCVRMQFRRDWSRCFVTLIYIKSAKL